RAASARAKPSTKAPAASCSWRGKLVVSRPMRISATPQRMLTRCAIVAALGAQVAGEDLLADAQRVGSDFDQLVAVDELERGLDAVAQGWAQDDVVVFVLAAHVGQLLFAADIDV